MPFLAQARSRSGLAGGRRAHEHEVDRVVGQVGDVGHDLDAEHLARLAARCRRRRPGSRRPGCCAGSRTRTCRDGSTRRRRARPAARTAPGSARRVSWRSSAATSTRASTGDRPAVHHDQRVEVGADDRRVGLRGAATARASTSTSAARSTAGSPRNVAEQRWVARSSIISSASTRVDRHEAERDVGDGLGEDPADAEHHGHAELRVVVQAGDQLAVAPQHRRHEQVHLAVLRAGGGRAGSLAASATASSSPRPEAHEAALGLVGDRSPAQLQHDRVAELGRGGHRLGHGGRPAARPGTPRRARPAGPSSRLRRGWAWRRTLRPHDGRAARASSRASTGRRGRGPPAPSVAAWCAARGMADYVYAPKDDPKHRERWREPYDDDELAGFDGFAADGALALGFAISPGLVDGPRRRRRPGAPWRQGRPGRRRRGGARSCSRSTTSPSAAAPRARPTPAHRVAPRAPRRPGRARRSCPPSTSAPAARPTSTRSPRACRTDVPIGVDRAGRRQRRDHRRRRRGRGPRRSAGARRCVWDNYPVNDGLMADRLFLGPLRGREPGLLDACSGYLANPMVQPCAYAPPPGVDRRLAAGRGPGRGLGDHGGRPRVAGLRPGLRRPRGRTRSWPPATGDLARPAPTSRTRPRAPRPASRRRPTPGCPGPPRRRRSRCAALEVLDGERARRPACSAMTLALAGVPPDPRSPCSARAARVRPVLGQADDGTWAVDPASVEARRQRHRRPRPPGPRRRSRAETPRLRLEGGPEEGADVLAAGVEQLGVERVAARARPGRNGMSEK